MTSSAPYSVSSVEFDPQSGLLFAQLSTGRRMPVYLYGPLDYHRKLKKVPWIDNWPEYSAAYAQSYSPLPALNTAPEGFEQQKRSGSQRFPWDQTTYLGFPLYIYGDGTQDDPASDTLPVDKKHMFQRVMIDLKTLEDELGEGDPDRACGP